MAYIRFRHLYIKHEKFWQHDNSEAAWQVQDNSWTENMYMQYDASISIYESFLCEFVKKKDHFSVVKEMMHWQVFGPSLMWLSLLIISHVEAYIWTMYLLHEQAPSPQMSQKLIPALKQSLVRCPNFHTLHFTLLFVSWIITVTLKAELWLQIFRFLYKIITKIIDMTRHFC